MRYVSTLLEILEQVIKKLLRDIGADVVSTLLEILVEQQRVCRTQEFWKVSTLLEILDV